MPKPTNPYHMPSKSIWLSFYRARTNEEYYWTGKDGLHLNQLIKKIQTKLSAKSMDPSIENVENSLKMFLESITDKWVIENLEVSIVNSKFNVLYKRATAASPLGIRDSVEEYLRRKHSQGAG